MRLVALSAVALVACVPAARATWSVVLADSRTGEVAVGSVTCLQGYDLRAITPVVRVGVGVATCQAAGDFDGQRRPVIDRELLAGTSPDDMLGILSSIAGHQRRQYGIVDVEGRAATFTGTGASAWAGGVIGQVGTLGYALQGNILAGACVVPAMEDAIRSTPGDVPAKLMAAMEAARAAGGDGRCSCPAGGPTDCGCPPASFTHSGNIGYLIGARRGDVDDALCDVDGCADGTYCLNVNVANASWSDPDPVLVLRAGFNSWRASLVGHPDAIQSRAAILPAGPNRMMEIDVLDFMGAPISIPVTVSVTHEASSARISTIDIPTPLGGNRWGVALMPGPGSGLDVFRVEISGGRCPAILMPSPSECFGDPCACDPGAGAPDLARNLRVRAGGRITWTAPARAFRHAIHSGALGELHADRGTSRSSCLAGDLALAEFVDARPAPAERDGWYYLAQGRNACGDGSVGTDSLGGARVVTGCP